MKSDKQNPGKRQDLNTPVPNGQEQNSAQQDKFVISPINS